MKKITIILILLFVNCTDMIIDDDSYKSIILSGGTWIEFENSDVTNFLNGDFSLQLWVSGMYDESNDAKILFSIINENDNSIELGLLSIIRRLAVPEVSIWKTPVSWPLQIAS